MFPTASLRNRLKETISQRFLLGNELTPELAAILAIYLVQGVLGLSRLAVSFFLKDELGLSPAEVSALTGVAIIPWTIKPLLGFISDGVPLFGYRRRSYTIISGLLGAASWLALATLVHSAIAAVIAIALSSLSVAISDVIADALVVERARRESDSDVGSLQSLCWGTSALGGIATAYFSGFLLEYVSISTVFLITATFPLLVAVVAWFIDEQPASGNESSMILQQVRQLRQAIAQKSILLPTLFIFLWQATPGSDSALFYFVTNELHFQPEFLGRVNLVASVASLAGVWLFQRFFRGVPFRTIFGWSTVIATVLGLTALLLVTHANRALGIGDRWFSLGDSAILTAMGQFAFMPVLVLAARLCPPGIEATFFALLMSISNFAHLVSRELGAGLTQWLGVTETNFENLWLLVMLTNFSTLLPLPLLYWLPAAQSVASETAEEGDRPVKELVPSEQ